jgi:hypothetical protein
MNETERQLPAILPALRLDGRWLHRTRAQMREFFLLERAARASLDLTDSQREAIGVLVHAAQRRRQVARNLADPTYRPVALSLYREACRLLVQACLAAKGDDGQSGDAPGPQADLRRLDALFQASQVAVPAAFTRANPLLLSPDPLAPDGLPAGEARQLVADFDQATGFLLGLVELRSPRQLTIVRAARLFAGAACALAVLVATGIGVFAPRKNLARGKPAVASSVMLDTAAAGAVDGSKGGKYGFHSALEPRPWLSIDLEKKYAISRVKVYGRGDEHNAQSIPLVLEASDDGATYRQIAVRTEPFSSIAPWTFTGPAFVGRFIRLRTQHRSYLVLGEVEVFGRAAF